MIFQRFILLFAVTLILSACGGGVETNSKFKTGILMDSAVDGLHYKTATQSGVTSNSGEFSFQDGEKIEFYLGKNLLGESTASSVLTPIDFITVEKHPDTLINILRLLQSLDDDNDPENGIYITPEVHEFANETDIDFSVSQNVFSSNQNVLELLAKSGKSTGLIEPGRAALHFQITLAQENIQTQVVTEIYHVGGLISGLNGQLKLTNYGLDEITVSNVDTFQFYTQLPDNAFYDVEISQQPSGQTCSLINSNGLIRSSDVSSISVICKSVQQNINGSVSGLSGSLILASETSRYFISSNGSFVVSSDQLNQIMSIERQPENQQCRIEYEMVQENIRYNIICINDVIQLGGSITGLLSDITLKNSDGSLLYVSRNGDFVFPNNYSLEQEYAIEIVKQPIGQNCKVTNAMGSVNAQSHAIIGISCDKSLFDITIDVLGLGTEIMPVYINGSLLNIDSLGLLTQSVAYTDLYELNFEPPITKNCKVSSGLAIGSMPASDIGLTISCTDINFQYEIKTDNYLGTFEVLNTNGNSIVIDSSVVYIDTEFGALFNFNINQHPVGQVCSVNTFPNTVKTPLTKISLSCVIAPIENQLPIANAGVDISALENTNISLDGRASTDADGQIVGYNWSQISGPLTTLNAATTVTPSFIAPNVSVDTTLIFSLAVTDNDGAQSVQANVTITIKNNNQLPVADAGIDVSVNEKSGVSLDGNLSSDVDGLITGFSWTQISGPVVTLNAVTTAAPSFIAPSVSADTSLTFALVVTDNNSGHSVQDTVIVTVLNVNQLPTADAGIDVSVNENTVVSLDGSASTDEDGLVASYNWTQILGPAIALNGAMTATPSFTAPSISVDTNLTFALVVTDNDGASSVQATVTVIVLNDNRLPTADAGVDVSVNENTDVSLDGSGSNDQDGRIVSYSWTQIAGPTVTLKGDTKSRPSFITPNVDTDTEVTFVLEVTDNDGGKAQDSITIMMKNVNQLPIADAGSEQNVNENSVVKLDGSASTDPDGSISSYKWVQTSGPVVTLSGKTIVEPSFTAPSVDVDTVMIFSLEVTDNDAATSTQATVAVTIQNVNQLPVVTIVPTDSVNENTSVSIDGSASNDPDGNIVTYLWEKTIGPDVILSDETTDTLSFTSPDVAVDTLISFSLTVTDNDGATEQGFVSINMKNVNQLPVAITGVDQKVKTESIVAIDGSGSVDIDGEITEYTWIQLSGSTVVLSDYLLAAPTFSAPKVTIDEILKFQLTITDNEAAIGITTTQVLVTPEQSYYILNPRIKNQDLNIVSLSDNNSITVGNTSLDLNINEIGVIPAADLNQGSQISGTSNFDVASDETGTDMLVPAQFSGTDFVIPHFRNSHTYYLLSPNFDANAIVNINGTSTDVSLSAGVVKVFDAGSDIEISGSIKTDIPILVSHSSGTDNDAYAVPPAAMELTGIRTDTVVIGALEDNTTITVTTSNGSTTQYLFENGVRYLELNIGSGGSEGRGDAYHITADKPIAAVQIADSDGVEATAFWPTSVFAVHYALPVDAQYIAVSCLTDVSVTLTDGTATTSDTQVCNSDGTIPGKAYFGSSTDGVNINAGAVLTSNGPIYVIYETASNNGEHNLLGNAF